MPHFPNTDSQSASGQSHVNQPIYSGTSYTAANANSLECNYIQQHRTHK